MASSGGVLNVYLGDLKDPWIAYCKQQNRKPGALLKMAVAAELEKAASSGVAENKIKKKTVAPMETAKTEKKKRQEVLLTESESKAVSEFASDAGSSRRQWLIDLIRAAVTGEPQFSMDELKALGESNYQLMMIGRNLNQIAKQMNEGRRDSVSFRNIKEVSDMCEKHIKLASAVSRANVERWGFYG